jgi:uncharacterized membrane protein
MDYLIISLRLIHIFAGVFWVGSALFSTFFLTPAITAAGDSGRQVLQLLMVRGKVAARLSAAAGLTILAGLFLYWLDTDGFSSPWSRSGPGIGFGIGAAFGLIGFLFGFYVGRINKSLASLSAELHGKPTPEQSAKLAGLQKSQSTVSWVSTVSLILATVFMSVARYFVF